VRLHSLEWQPKSFREHDSVFRSFRREIYIYIYSFLSFMYDETRAAQHAPRFLARAEAAAKIWVFHTCLLHECAVVREAFTWTGASTRAAATVVVRTCVRACVRACVHARVSSCVPDAAPIDIGCVSSVEVTLLVYIHVMHMQIDFRWPEKLINVTIHMYPYLSKREKKRERGI